MTSSRFTRRGLAASALALGALGLAGSRLLKEPDDPFLKTRFPDGLPLGNGDLGLPDRGRHRGRRPRPVDLGHLRQAARQDPRRRQRRHRRRPLPPLQGGRGADEGAGREDLPLLDRLAAPLPGGTRHANPKGLAFYQRLIDELLANGIEPYATLYHWDLPQALQDRGGWESRDTAQAFADYAGYVARQIGDRVGHFFTLNEMRSFVELGYGSGVFAPGLALPKARLYQVRHHAVLAHGLGVQAVRANGRAGLKVGPAENITIALPDVETPTQRPRRRGGDARAERALSHRRSWRAAIPTQYLKAAGADAPRFTEADLKTISTPVDFVGINVYGPGAFVRARDRRRDMPRCRCPLPIRI